ncbi:MAG: YggS family pyridoxal phosphate-dependent enzyme [Hyphomicrobiales bacterium]
MSYQGLDTVRRRICEAAFAVGRDPASIALIAVSKTFATASIETVIAAGQRAFGENRVQEAKAKWPELKRAIPDVELHLIGPLQSNKAGEAVALFDAIHTIDRPKIAEAIAGEIAKQGRRPQLFIQINTGLEPQKTGIAPVDADRFIADCRHRIGLAVTGLMCIPPLHEAPRPHFELLREIVRRNGLAGLSMGMSGDFEEAISCGATHVRVGTAIFGARD